MSDTETSGVSAVTVDMSIRPAMTLRDEFAMAALTGAMTRESFADGLDFRDKAEWVYLMADAMLKARK